MGSDIKTFADYMSDESRVSPAEREQIEFEVGRLKKMVEARESKGITQRELAEMRGVRQPAIARLESMRSTPRIDTLFKVLSPLGYTLAIVPKEGRQAGVASG